MLRSDCLTPIRRSFAFPLVPPYLSSPRFDGWIDPAGRRAFPGGALVTRWTPPECSAPHCSAISRQEADEALTSSRVIPLSA